MSRFWLVVLCLALSPTCAAESADSPFPASRYTVRASLQAVSPALEAGRFGLRASLQPSPSSQREAVGLALKASLVVKDAPKCPPPGFIFGSSFEALSQP